MITLTVTDATAAVIRDAVTRAGGLRALARVLVEHTPLGYRPVSPTQLKNLSDAMSIPDGRTMQAIFGAYPDIGERLYTAAGYDPPAPQPPTVPQPLNAQEVEFAKNFPQGWKHVQKRRRIAELRGIPEEQVQTVLFNEELKRLGEAVEGEGEG